MLHTNVAMLESRLQSDSLVVPSTVHLPDIPDIAVRRERQTDAAIDEALAKSFPASDPPAWNPGVARPVPGGETRERVAANRRLTTREAGVEGTPGVIDVSRPHGSERTFVQSLISLAGAAGITLLVPFAILLVGLPVALAIRGVLEVVRWLLSALP